jgi:hypothetical protein
LPGKLRDDGIEYWSDADGKKIEGEPP